MIGFRELSHYAQMALILFTWLCVFAQLILPVYRCSIRRSLLHTLLDGGLLCGLLVLLCIQIRMNRDFPQKKMDLPAAALTCILAASSVYTVVSLSLELRRSRRKINEWSVKEAIDDLSVGLLFADDSGQVILMNRSMAELSHMLIGRLPRTLSELTCALTSPASKSRVEVMADIRDCYRFSNGRIYRFCRDELRGEGVSGYVQLAAHDETERCEKNLHLRENTEKLKRVNQQLRKMYARMEDEVREKESLHLKIWLHDTLGSSLLTIQDVRNSASVETEHKLKNLREAVGMLAANRSKVEGTFDEAQKKAEQLGVRVTLDGYIPPDTMAEQIITAAVRECVTNCIRHAGGDRVHVAVSQKLGILRVQITNNGKAPDGPIKEGSGLTALRRSIETAGGEMTTSHYPAFALTLYLSGMEEDAL